jgi:hypothetical protein
MPYFTQLRQVLSSLSSRSASGRAVWRRARGSSRSAALLRVEALEDRRLLSVGPPELGLLDLSPTLEENQGPNAAVYDVDQSGGAGVVLSDAGSPSVTTDSPTVTVNEGQTATNTGTWFDPQGDEVTLSASVGQVFKNADGTWIWSFATSDGPTQSQIVTITASDGAASSTVSFALLVQNVAPRRAAGGAPVHQGPTAPPLGTGVGPRPATGPL